MVTRPADADRLFFVNETPCFFDLSFSVVAPFATPAASEPPATAVTSSVAPTRRDGMYFMQNLLMGRRLRTGTVPGATDAVAAWFDPPPKSARSGMSRSCLRSGGEACPPRAPG